MHCVCSIAMICRQSDNCNPGWLTVYSSNSCTQKALPLAHTFECLNYCRRREPFSGMKDDPKELCSLLYHTEQ